jgi:hypothetical protein
MGVANRRMLSSIAIQGEEPPPNNAGRLARKVARETGKGWINELDPSDVRRKPDEVSTENDLTHFELDRIFHIDCTRLQFQDLTH